MYLKTITLDPASPGIPHPLLVSGIGSDVILLISGVPQDFTPVFIVQTDPESDPIAVYGTLLESGLWSIILGGWNFTAASCLYYDILIQNTETNQTCFTGRGTLQILNTYTTGDLPNPPPSVPAFAVNTVTGLKYPIFAVTNADGDTTLTVGQIPLNPPTEG